MPMQVNRGGNKTGPCQPHIKEEQTLFVRCRAAMWTHASFASGLASRWCQASMSSSVAGRLRSTKMPVLYALQHVLPALYALQQR
jgi:hypothetical protein